MTYRVEVSGNAKAAIREYVRFIAVERKAPISAERWLAKVWDAIDSLEYFPHRCQFAPENELQTYKVRMRRVGNYLLLFTIDEATKTVHVIGFRHGHKSPLTDLPEDAPQ
jgi:toxin ParE1/3/4